MFSYRHVVTLAILLFSSLLLFSRLGHYSLWDDESLTALAAKSVWETGDTGVKLGQNIVAHRNGNCIRNWCDRSTPPLPAYLDAPFLALLGETSFAARLPFALLGLGTVGVILRWLWRANPPWHLWVITGIAIIGNVSLMLYARQCRYYSPVIFLSACVVYLYAHFDGRRRSLLLLAAASLALLATHYIAFVGVLLCLGVDYLIWGRRRYWLTWRQWVGLLAPLVVLGLPIVLIWNPLGLGLSEQVQSNPLAMKFALMWTNIRDLNRAEFAPLLLLIAAPVVWLFTRQAWLLRGTLALVLFVIVVSFLSPQTFPPERKWHEVDADIRYIVPAIPLCIGMAVLVFGQIPPRFGWVAVVLAPLVFGTNVVHRIPGVRFERSEYSSIAAYVGELLDPPPEPYKAVAEWINTRVASGEKVWVLPDWMCYPLMFHAPKAVYMWQFRDPPPAHFASLEPVHIAGRVLPDYIIAFGPIVGHLIQNFKPPPGVRYELIDSIDCFWKDQFRPELFQRSFKPTPANKEGGTGIYVIIRTSP